MDNLIFIKFGGSVITDKTRPYTVEHSTLRYLCNEVKEGRRKFGLKVIIGHGGGSFPHTSAEKYRTKNGYIDEKSPYGFCVVGRDAGKLNLIVTDQLLELGENAFTIRVSSGAISENGRITRWDLTHIKQLLEMDIIPVTYGDVIVDLNKKFTIVSTEEIFRFMARELRPSKVILVSRYAVHESDPNTYYRAEKIDLIDGEMFESLRTRLSGSHGFDVTGGMLRKVELAMEIAEYAEHVEIIPSNPGNLLKAMEGGEHVGTIIKG